MQEKFLVECCPETFCQAALHRQSARIKIVGRLSFGELAMNCQVHQSFLPLKFLCNMEIIMLVTGVYVTVESNARGQW